MKYFIFKTEKDQEQWLTQQQWESLVPRSWSENTIFQNKTPGLVREKTDCKPVKDKLEISCHKRLQGNCKRLLELNQ